MPLKLATDGTIGPRLAAPQVLTSAAQVAQGLYLALLMPKTESKMKAAEALLPSGIIILFFIPYLVVVYGEVDSASAPAARRGAHQPRAVPASGI